MKKSLEKISVYQIYVKSFMDSNGDGIGDIPGITQKLDYLKDLGVDFLWLTPIYPSPMNDNGYDVAEYTSINPLFGTMQDFDMLLSETKKRGIELMLDMVFNHTSTEQEWFKRAINGEKKYMDYYIFKDRVNGKEPTNWISKFGGNAWEYLPHLNKYYLHLFDKTQADLNWENPELREEIYNIVNFWIEKGVKGFRFDVINLISKGEYKNDLEGDGRRFYTDGPKVHEYIHELNQRTYGKYDDIITVGEMSSTSMGNCILYTQKERAELSMTFNFHHLKVDYEKGHKWSLKPFDFEELKRLLISWQIGMSNAGGYNALFWSNHDQPRVVSRLGNDKSFHELSAKMLATSTYLMKGTPYIYQGEEIGMTNAYFSSIEEYRDVESLNYYTILLSEGKKKEEALEILASKSRDNARTPMQWDASRNSGFTKGRPWIDTNANHIKINAKLAYEDKTSIFHYFKTVLNLKKHNDTLAYGDFEEGVSTDSILSYKRVYKESEVLVICNYFAEVSEYPLENFKGYKILLSNYERTSFGESNSLEPYEALVLSKY